MALSFKEQLQKTGIGDYPADILANSVARVTADATGKTSIVDTSGFVFTPKSLSAPFRNAKDNNPRVNANTTSGSAAFGSTPTAGTVGYANTGITTTGYNFRDLTTTYGTNEDTLLPFAFTGASPYNAVQPLQSIAYYTKGLRSSGIAKLSFVTNAPEPVLYGIGYSSTYHCNVDGKRLTNGIVSGSGGGYTQFSINLRGLGSGYHTIEILYEQDLTIGGIYTPKNSVIYPPERKPLAIIFTDSLGNTSSTAGGKDCFPAVMADYLGMEVYTFGAGGTGYTNAGSFETFVDRIPLAASILSRSPDLVIFAGGTNDQFQGVAIQTAVAKTVSLAKATWSAPIVVTGSWSGRGANDVTNNATVENYIKAGISGTGVTFIPVMTDTSGPWINGTGYTQAPNGTGIADVMFDVSDGIHWNAAGHAMIGRRLAYGIAKALNL